ncbi:MAG: aromatic acid exporter family protein, partial [Thermomicrobiales bacterium]
MRKRQLRPSFGGVEAKAEFRRRMATATLVATGSEGPLRVALDGLRRVGLGERVVKTALAAGIAWEIGHAIHADPLPVLAPLTAIFTIQLTLAKSLRGSVQRVLGVI